MASHSLNSVHPSLFALSVISCFKQNEISGEQKFFIVLLPNVRIRDSEVGSPWTSSGAHMVRSHWEKNQRKQGRKHMKIEEVIQEMDHGEKYSPDNIKIKSRESLQLLGTF